MHQFPFSLLLVLSLFAPSASAQETSEAVPAASAADQQLSASESPADSSPLDADSALTLLKRLRQENQRLRLQLQEAQAQAPLPLLDVEQQWFAVGGAVGATSFLLGLLVTRGRRRRQWLN